MLRADLILMNDRCVNHSFPFSICLDITVYDVLPSISLYSPFLFSCSVPTSLRVSLSVFLFIFLSSPLSFPCLLPPSLRISLLFPSISLSSPSLFETFAHSISLCFRERVKGQSSQIGVVDCKIFYSLRLAAQGFVSNELCGEKKKVSADTTHAI